MRDYGQTEQALLAGLKDYDRAVEDRRTPEREIQRMVEELDALVPQGDFSDLLFWGERERNHNEIVDEAIRRQKLFVDEGELALLIYKDAQLRSALSDPNTPAWAENYIESELPRISAKIASLGAPRIH